MCDNLYVHRRFVLLSLLLLAAACARSAAQGDFVLRVAVVGPLAPLHPLVHYTGMTAAQDLVFEQILTPDEQGVLRSRVMQRWERLDGDRYRIKLDPGVRFSDGSPVRAEDVIASLTARSLRGSISGEWIDVEPGGAGLPVEPALLFTLLFKQTPSGFLGTGPFRLVEQTETRLALERLKAVRGRINRVEVLAFPTPADVFVQVLRGNANAAFSLEERQLVLFEDLPTLKPLRSVSPHAVTIIFNPARLNASTRRSLRAALPVETIARVFGGSAWTEGRPYERAELPSGRRLEIMVPRHTNALDRAALAVRRALQTRGGEIAHVDASEHEARERAGDFDIAIRPALAWPQAVIALSWQTGAPGNLAHYSNPRVDAAFARGDLAAAAAELEADAAFVEICRRERFGVVDARIKNPRLGWWGVLDTLADWEVAE